MNLVVLIGRLTKDAELKQSESSGKSYTRFTVAVDRPVSKGQEKQADFINCAAFGKTAELVAQYFGKGSKIGVEGSLQIGSYTNKDGQKVPTADIMVNRVEFIDSRKANNQGSPMDSFGAPAFDDDIPF